MKKQILCVITVYVDGTTTTKQVYHEGGEHPAPGANALDDDGGETPTKPPQSPE